MDELDQLILAAIGGDERAADRVLSRHYDELRAMVAGMTGEVLRRHYPVEDIVQEVAVKILRSIHTLEVDSDPTRCFRAWMRPVALNVV
ncbi:MAG: sigma factor, partial [Phycisphaerales bacterium]